MEKKFRIAVIGTGAIGGICAVHFARAGWDVTAVCKYPELAKRIKKEGLHVFGISGDFHVRMQAVPKLSGLKGLFDFVFIGVKVIDLPDAARDVLPYLKPESMVISLQNGFCIDTLAEIAGVDRSVGCVVGWGATMHAPGEVEMTSGGNFIIGRDGSHRDDLEKLKTVMEAVVPVEITDNIRGHLYSKLIINSCVTTLGAVCGLYLGEMLLRRDARVLFIRIIREALDTAKAMGIKVEPFAGKLDYYRLIAGEGILSDFRRHLLILFIGFRYRRLKSSSLQSLERNKPTEIDYLNGYIAKQGKSHGIDTPVNSAIFRMVHEIEAGIRKIGPENFRDLQPHFLQRVN